MRTSSSSPTRADARRARLRRARRPSRRGASQDAFRRLAALDGANGRPARLHGARHAADAIAGVFSARPATSGIEARMKNLLPRAVDDHRRCRKRRRTPSPTPRRSMAGGRRPFWSIRWASILRSSTAKTSTRRGRTCPISSPSGRSSRAKSRPPAAGVATHGRDAGPRHAAAGRRRPPRLGE